MVVGMLYIIIIHLYNNTICQYVFKKYFSVYHNVLLSRSTTEVRKHQTIIIIAMATR